MTTVNELIRRKADGEEIDESTLDEMAHSIRRFSGRALCGEEREDELMQAYRELSKESRRLQERLEDEKRELVGEINGELSGGWHVELDSDGSITLWYGQSAWSLTRGKEREDALSIAESQSPVDTLGEPPCESDCYQ